MHRSDTEQEGFAVVQRLVSVIFALLFSLLECEVRSGSMTSYFERICVLDVHESLSVVFKSFERTIQVLLENHFCVDERMRQ